MTARILVVDDVLANVKLLEARLAAHWGLGPGTVVTVANGTIGLTLALAAQAPPLHASALDPRRVQMSSDARVKIAGHPLRVAGRSDGIDPGRLPRGRRRSGYT